MENNPKKEPMSIEKISFLCSAVAIFICSIFLLIEWWNHRLFDHIWVILIIVNACILLATWKMKKN